MRADILVLLGGIGVVSMTTSLFNAWKVLDRVLTADRERVAATEADRVQDRSLDALQRQVDELRGRVEWMEDALGSLRARTGG